MGDQRVFWIGVDPRGPVPDNMHSRCWIWQGTLGPDGYGYFGGTSAHRFAWTSAYGLPPVDRTVCHWCDVRSCVRPSHLWLGTKELNMLDAMRKGRRLNSVLKKPAA